MAAFIRSSAVLIGLANALTFTYVGSSEELIGDFADPAIPLAYHVAFAIFGALAGLLTAELLLRRFRLALSGAFLRRCAALMFGLCFGGALLATLLTANNLMFFVDASAGNSVASLIAMAPVLFVLGGIAGFLEGLVLAVPLAILLGTFENEATALARSRA